MTLDEVRDWALAHGFAEDGPDRVSCPYGGVVVSMTFAKRDVVVEMSKGDLRQRILRAHPKNAHVNDLGVVEGLGLSASFLASYAREGRPKPAWMPDAYVEALGRPDLVAPEEPSGGLLGP